MIGIIMSFIIFWRALETRGSVLREYAAPLQRSLQRTLPLASDELLYFDGLSLSLLLFCLTMGQQKLILTSVPEDRYSL